MWHSSRFAPSFEPANTLPKSLVIRSAGGAAKRCALDLFLSKGSDAVAEVEFERATGLQALGE